MKLLIVQFHPVPCHLVPLTPTYFPQHPAIILQCAISSSPLSPRPSYTHIFSSAPCYYYAMCNFIQSPATSFLLHPHIFLSILLLFCNVQFHPVPCHLVPLTPTYFPQHPAIILQCAISSSPLRPRSSYTHIFSSAPFAQTPVCFLIASVSLVATYSCTEVFVRYRTVDMSAVKMSWL
jgi:hypothetical protein